MRGASQDLGYMTIKGSVIANGKSVEDVRAQLYKNGVKVKEEKTGSNGKFTFTELSLTVTGDEYIIELSKPGHVTLKHWVSTKVPSERGVSYPVYIPTIELFDNVAGLDDDLTSILEKPISRFSYNPEKKDFFDDKAYFNSIRARVEQLFTILRAEADERYKLIADYRRKKMEEEKKKLEAEKKKKEIEEQYKAILVKADKQFSEKDFFNAKAFYLQAHNLLPDEQYASGKIDEIDRLLSSAAAEEETKKESLLKTEMEQMAKEDAMKAEEEKKNKEIKIAEEKKLLDAGASEESANAEKEKKLKLERERKEAEIKTAQEQMKRETEARAAAWQMNSFARQEQAKTEANKQIANAKFQDLLTLVAEADRTAKIESGKERVASAKSKMILPATKFPRYEYIPRIITMEDKEIMKTVKTTIIYYPTRRDTLQRVTYLIGGEDYFKNRKEIDKDAYTKEINKYNFFK